jgi:hypothetical protein
MRIVDGKEILPVFVQENMRKGGKRPVSEPKPERITALKASDSGYSPATGTALNPQSRKVRAQ